MSTVFYAICLCACLDAPSTVEFTQTHYVMLYSQEGQPCHLVKMPRVETLWTSEYGNNDIYEFFSHFFRIWSVISCTISSMISRDKVVHSDFAILINFGQNIMMYDCPMCNENRLFQLPNYTL